MNQDVTVAVAREFEAVFRVTFPRLVSMGVVKTGRVDIARELAQETMLRAHARWDEISGLESPEAWCHVVMTNLLIDHHRTTVSEQRAVERLGQQPEATESVPSLDRWNELIAPLPDRQRLILALYYAQDCSVREVADLLGRTSGAVKTGLFKARRTLRRRLAEESGHG